MPRERLVILTGAGSTVAAGGALNAGSDGPSSKTEISRRDKR